MSLELQDLRSALPLPGGRDLPGGRIDCSRGLPEDRSMYPEDEYLTLLGRALYSMNYCEYLALEVAWSVARAERLRGF